MYNTEATTHLTRMYTYFATLTEYQPISIVSL